MIYKYQINTLRLPTRKEPTWYRVSALILPIHERQNFWNI